MTALTGPRATPARERTMLSLPVAAAVTLYAGALAALDANGRATPGATATTLKGLGRVRDTVDNSAGAAGAKTVDIELGVFRFDNAAADPITAASIGSLAYIVDDQTVAKTSGTNTRSVAGVIADVDDNGVWIDFTAGTAN